MAQKRRLPKAYQELESIAFPSGAYINTGITPTTFDYQVYFNGAFEVTSAGPNCAWGFMAESTIPRWLCASWNEQYLLNANTTNGFDEADTNAHEFLGEVYTKDGEEWYKATLDGVVKQDSNLHTSTGGFNGNTLSMYLGARHNASGAGNFGLITAKSFWVKKAGNLIANYIPAKNRTTDILGMYDLCNSGKNLWDKVSSYIGGVRVLYSSQSLDATKTYTISFNVSNDYTYSSIDWLFSLRLNGAGKQNITTSSLIAGQRYSCTFTNIDLVQFYNQDDYNGTISNIMIEESSTATAYEPYPFYTNSGTGAFTAGPVVQTYDLVPESKKGVVFTSSNLYDVSETAIGSIAELQAITKPTKSRANVTTSTTVGANIAFTANAKGIVIPCSKGDTFTIKSFGTIGMSRRYYVECDTDGKNLMTRTSYTGYTEITTTKDDCAYLFIEWSIDATDEADVVVVKGDTLPTSYIPYGQLLAPLSKSAVVSTRLPSGYIELEYIEMPTTGYINTNIRANPAYTNAKMRVCMTDVTGITGLFGARGATSSSIRSYNIFGAVSGANGRFDNTYPAQPYVFLVNTWYDIELGHNGLKGTALVNDMLLTGAQNMSDEEVGAIYIGDFCNNGRPFTIGTPAKWSSVEIYADGTTLSGKFIPAKNSSNVVGMYDLVTNQFFTNAGTGTFTAGPEVHHLHPTTQSLIYVAYD